MNKSNDLSNRGSVPKVGVGLGSRGRPQAVQGTGPYTNFRDTTDAQDDVADGGGQPSLAVAVARGGHVLAGHVRLRVHDLVHHGLQERARQLPHVEEPVAVGGELL